MIMGKWIISIICFTVVLGVIVGSVLLVVYDIDFDIGFLMIAYGGAFGVLAMGISNIPRKGE